MNSSKLNESRLNTTNNIDYLELDLEKIREFIKLLEEHQLKCEKNGKYVEAELAKQRVTQFKKIEEEKQIIEAKQLHEEQKQIVEREYKEELNEFNEHWDKEFNTLNATYNEQEQKLKQDHDNELKSRMEQFESSYSTNIKPSAEILNMNRILELAVKQKDYPKAHQLQVRIAELSKQDEEKFLEEKDRKAKLEYQKIKTKHENEINAFQLKFQNTYGEFKKNRAINLEKYEYFNHLDCC